MKGATLAAAANAAGALAAASALSSPADPAAPQPLGKVALEEHFMVPEFMDYFAETYPNISPEIAGLAPIALEDFGDRRLSVMDRHRVDFVVLSLAGPGVQAEKDAAVALKKSKWVNDFLAREIAKRPTRYGGFAHLAMQNPADAADELERCVREPQISGRYDQRPDQR